MYLHYRHQFNLFNPMGYNKIIPIKDGNLCISVRNPRLIVISPPKPEYEVRDSESRLIGLNCCGDFTIQEGEILTLGKQKYKIQEITRESSQASDGAGYYLHVHKKLSKTSNFLLPLLGSNRNAYRWTQNFANSYIGLENDGDYGDSLYLLYRYDGTKLFAEFEADIKEHPWYEQTIDTDPYHVLFKFNFPEEVKEEVNLIINGKYSKISEQLKTRILDFHLSGKDRPLGQILYKSPQRKKALEEELGGKIPEDLDLLDAFKSEDEVFMSKYIISDGRTSTSDII